MTEIEAMILLNQSAIMTALALLVIKPLDDVLMKQAEDTVKYVEKNHPENNLK